MSQLNDSFDAINLEGYLIKFIHASQDYEQ